MADNRELWTTRVRRSPIYRALGFLPTPARPWIMAFEAIASLQLANQARRFHRREALLERQLSAAQLRRAKAEQARAGVRPAEAPREAPREAEAVVTRRRGPGVVTLAIGAGLAYLAARYLTTPGKPTLRVSGFVDEALDRVQALSDASFEQLRANAAHVANAEA